MTVQHRQPPQHSHRHRECMRRDFFGSRRWHISDGDTAAPARLDVYGIHSRRLRGYQTKIHEPIEKHLVHGRVSDQQRLGIGGTACDPLGIGGVEHPDTYSGLFHQLDTGGGIDIDDVGVYRNRRIVDVSARHGNHLCTDVSSVNSKSPSIPNSRPTPECFHPPKGASTLKSAPLISTCPVFILPAMLNARSLLPAHTDPLSP